MYVPLVSPWLESRTGDLERRKGGGGGGRGGGSSGGSGGKSGGSSGSSSSGAARGSPGSSTPVRSASGSTSNAKSYGGGSAIVTTIPAGQPFAGRSSGGGLRDSIFGTRQYGSGYPGTTTPSVVNRGFPFGYWPIGFGIGAGLGVDSRFRSNEYGDPNNSSRPGGPLFDAPFQPPDGSNTYRVLSDNSTVQALIGSIVSNCSLSTTSISAVPYNESDPFQPKPESIIQYYRASSIALSLDGYNNSAVFSSDDNAPNTPLPSNLNGTFLDCLNQTIGAAAPLLDDASRVQVSGLLCLAWVASHFLRWYL